MEEKTIPCKNKNIACRAIGDETILLPIYRSSEEMDCIYTLNKPAAWVWDRIDGKRSWGALKKQLLKEFDVTEGEAEKKLQELKSDLEKIKALGASR